MDQKWKDWVTETEQDRYTLRRNRGRRPPLSRQDRPYCSSERIILPSLLPPSMIKNHLQVAGPSSVAHPHGI